MSDTPETTSVNNTTETTVTETVASLPTIAFGTLLQPVSNMLRNCLISKNKALKNVDFTHLQMLIPSVSDTSTTASGELLIKPASLTKYKLASKQVYTYDRIDTDTAFTDLGIAVREFTKQQYEEVDRLVRDVGTITILSGDIGNPKGDVIASFVFGERNDGNTKTRIIDLGATNLVKAHFDVAFRGSVRLVFKGLPLDNTNETPSHEDTETPNAPPVAPGGVDLNALLNETNLGDVVTRNSVNQPGV